MMGFAARMVDYQRVPPKKVAGYLHRNIINHNQALHFWDVNYWVTALPFVRAGTDGKRRMENPKSQGAEAKF